MFKQKDDTHEINSVKIIKCAQHAFNVERTFIVAAKGGKFNPRFSEKRRAIPPHSTTAGACKECPRRQNEGLQQINPPERRVMEGGLLCNWKMIWNQKFASFVRQSS